MKKVLYILGILSDQDADWLIRVGERRSLKSESLLVREGQRTEAVFIVLQGELSVRSQAAGGREIDRLGPGEVVGEMSFVDSLPPSATVTVADDAVVLAVARPILEEKLRSDEGFASRFYRALATFLSDRVRNLLDQMDEEASPHLADNVIESDELDPNVLDGVYLAGLRFERILRHMQKDA